LSQHLVFQPELVICDLNLRDIGKIYGLERVAHVSVCIVPKDNPVIIELSS